MSIYSIVYV